ncbi:hypothetical protein GCM10022198_00210 [Klugiella xanthotipulae]|uniref:Uncharacterized protein n=1 Tax=Klugiella xanthotipulae TaxID=244735 RepID=A0A543I5I8_9MICO|nr:hypothetical protein [Klugiella xanthotipulae]TQM65838.1 hypothetical protein FB466_0652 [Klugiella xanthotipulae]
MVQIKVRFPVGRGTRNHKAIREAVLLDTYDNGFERAIVAAAERAKTPDQEIFVTRGFSQQGRFSVLIVDRGTGDREARRKALHQALARVSA